MRRRRRGWPYLRKAGYVQDYVEYVKRCPWGEEDEADLTWVKLDMSRTMLNMFSGAQEAKNMRLTSTSMKFVLFRRASCRARLDCNDQGQNGTAQWINLPSWQFCNNNSAILLYWYTTVYWRLLCRLGSDIDVIFNKMPWASTTASFSDRSFGMTSPVAVLYVIVRYSKHKSGQT